MYAMKSKILTILSFFSLLAFSGLLPMSCTIKNSREVDLKKDEELREVIFNQIINDQELFNEFMIASMENQNTMHWMMDNQTFMHSMFSGRNFNYMMTHPSGMGNYMMREFYDNIRNDSVLSSHWQNMMQDYNMHPGMMPD